MNVFGGTVVILSFAATATLFLIKCKQAKDNSEVLPLADGEDENYYEDLAGEYYDQYELFYNPMQEQNIVPATFTGKLKANVKR